jgi:hypothetical protein
MNWKFWQASRTPGLPPSVATQAAGAVAAAFALYLLSCVALAFWWDHEPDDFSVSEYAQAHAAQRGQTVVRGYTTVATLVGIADTLLEKRGGFIANDLFPPGVWLDNMPAWEFGVLVQLRDASRANRIDFSRSQSQSAEDPDLSEAEGKFFFDNSSWAFPPSESEYREGVRYLEKYLERLADADRADAQFYARSDNLRNWLAGVETRLGSLSQRLSAAVGKRQLNIDLAGDATARQSTTTPADTRVKTPWLEIDDVFYEARGYTWSLILLLRAVERDFGELLDRKNARVSLQQIVRELEPTQDTLWSPMVLNGDGLGLLANHSLVMASYIARANAAIIDLRALLAQG